MTDREKLESYIQKAETELTTDILPFWIRHGMDKERGGFYGGITNNLAVDKDAPRGALLSSRILWTYSAAYRRYPDPAYLDMARWAFDDLMTHFWDAEYGGLYWVVDAWGQPVNTRKQIYGQAFGIYALSEYFSAAGEGQALDKAAALFRAIQEHGYDAQNGGYLEAYTRDWQLEQDLRLSAVDMNEKKSMNTHLHVMEAYTNLLRAWRNADVETSFAVPPAELERRQKELIQVMMQHIVHLGTYHTTLFFDECWRRRSDHVSFGHDIETSWLLVEAAEVAGDRSLIEPARSLALNMAQTVYNEGLDADGGLMYEAGPSGWVDDSKEWWPQAEAAVGFLNAYQLGGQEHFFHAALRSWDFIEAHLIDRQYGEWLRGVYRDGTVKANELKVSFWKCPYHNGRACMEMAERLKGLL